MNHEPPSAPLARPRDDRILVPTRVFHAVLAVVVLPFFVSLTFYPEHTGANFAWPLAPRMSAMFFGALYLAVAYSFARVAFSRKWHHVALVMWATPPVLAVLGVLTLVYWDKFTKGTLVFGVWFFVYVCFPPFLVWMLLANRRRDPKTPDPDDVVIPRPARIGTAVLGALFGAVGAALMLFPEAMMGVWPWAIKPLSARALGSLFIAPALTHLVALEEKRWSCLKLPTEAAILWFTAIAVAVVRCWDEFDTQRPLTWVFLAVLAGEWCFSVWTWLGLERRRRDLHGRAS